MAKPQLSRKTRLEAGGRSAAGTTTAPSVLGFLGFGAFAVVETAAAPAAAAGSDNNNDDDGDNGQQQQQQQSSMMGSVAAATVSVQSVATSIVWTPVYTGKDARLGSLFARIGQKRDAVTVCKALQELQLLFVAAGTGTADANVDNDNTISNNNSNDRRLLAEAVRHYAWLYHSKLAAPCDAASVRAAALHTWTAAAQRVPKAVAHALCYCCCTFVSQQQSQQQQQQQSQQREILGMVYAAQTDPAQDVRAAATAATAAIRHAYSQTISNNNSNNNNSNNTNNSNNNNAEEWWLPWEAGILTYTSRIFSYGGRASDLYAALNVPPVKRKTTTADNNNNSSISKSCDAEDKNNKNTNNTTKNEEQRGDAMEELYVRLVGNCLDCVSMWLLQRQQLQRQQLQQQDHCDAANHQIEKAASLLWWKTLTNSQHQQHLYSSLRRKTYQLLTVVASSSSSAAAAQRKCEEEEEDGTPNPLLPRNIAALLPQALSVEREAANIPTLLETVLSVLAHYHHNRHPPRGSKNNIKNIDKKEAKADDDANDENSGALSSSSSSPTVLSQLTAATVKPLCKILTKACYGAKVETWGPTLLPLIAQFASRNNNNNDDDINNNDNGMKQQLLILRAAVTGLPLTLGETDQWHLWAAVAESALFVLLLRTTVSATTSTTTTTADEPSSPPDGIDATTAQKLAELWLEALHFFLVGSTTTTTTTASAKTPLKRAAKAASPAAVAARTRLLQDLAKQLVQLDAAASQQQQQQRPNCAFGAVSDWFWNDQGLILMMGEEEEQRRSRHRGELSVANLAQLLVELMRISSSSNSRQRRTGTHDSIQRPSLVVDRLLPQLRQIFLSTLKQYQTSSSSLPSEDAYGFFQAVLDCCGPLSVFVVATDNTTNYEDAAIPLLEKFVMNDLLRWTVIHTSTPLLSTVQRQQPAQIKSLVEQDFQLFASCLEAIPSISRPALWESFLREIIASKCDLGLLIVGLSALLVLAQQQEKESAVNWLRCDTLDTFAIDVVRLATEDLGHHHHSEAEILEDDESVDTAHTGEDDQKLEFYRVCLGLASDAAPMLVGTEVLSSWVDYACPPQSPTGVLPSNGGGPGRLVLEALLQTIQKKRSVLSGDQVDRILLASWRSSDQLFEIYTSKILHAEVSLWERFKSVTSKDLRDLVSFFLAQPCTDQSVRSWAMGAWRLMRLNRDVGMKYPLPNIGFEDIDLWRKHPMEMFRLSMSLLRLMDVESDRLALVESWAKSDYENMIVDLLVSLSEASSDALVAARSRERKDRCAEFLSAIGGKSIDESLVDRLIRAAVSRLSADLKQEPIVDCDIRSRIAVLSQLLDLIFLPVLPDDSGQLKVEDIAEGDYLWYISDPKIPEVREEVTVAKVHYDSQAGYFFSIRTKQDGEPQERQTVIERLRKEQQSDSLEHGILMSCITDKEWSKRACIRDLVWKDLIAPCSSFITHAASLGELVNVIVSQIGVGKERGIGSSHYDIHRCISSVEHQVIVALDNMDVAVSGTSIWSLSLALGFGLSSPASKWTMSQIRVNPIPLTTRLLGHYAIHEVGTNLEFDCASAAWLIVSGNSALDFQEAAGEILERSLILLFQIASHVLEKASGSKFTGPAMIACRAISEGISLSARMQFQPIGLLQKPSLSRAQADAFFFLVQAFATGWESEASRIDSSATPSPSLPDWASFSSMRQLVLSAHENKELHNCFAAASGSKNVGALCDALFIPSKRYLAFLLLGSVSLLGKPLQNADGSVMLADQTSNRLKSWSNGLEEEEAAEVEEDVYIVAEWVPLQMMDEIESWADKGFEMDDESVITGRLLTWLCFLRFVDAAAPLDFRNRPAFVSYIGKCGAASSILNLGLLHNEVINDRKCKMVPTLLEVGDLLKNESSLDVTQVATLSLFRTVEVLPSLSRRWWEDDCPQVYTVAVQALVEKYVAPEILKRELERIKSATTFGPMSVTASLVSREVTAAYVQDDFTLKVLIALPSAFPFRSAEVDCSKTLGVPQNRWKRWSLQITLMLNSQGGTLQDALMLWKDNVDKEFEGVEPCPVCYSVLHVKTHKLPSLECKTCHNRFHLDCLSQWFRSSGKSQCVICQQPWQGTRIQ